MSDNKKYYYMKLKEDFYHRTIIRKIKCMESGNEFVNILLEIYLESIKFDGKVMITEDVPYKPEDIANFFNHRLETVQKAITIFLDLKLIKICNGIIYALQIQDYIGKESTAALRKRKYRQRIDQEEKLLTQEHGKKNKDTLDDSQEPSCIDQEQDQELLRDDQEQNQDEFTENGTISGQIGDIVSDNVPKKWDKSGTLSGTFSTITRDRDRSRDKTRSITRLQSEKDEKNSLQNSETIIDPFFGVIQQKKKQQWFAIQENQDRLKDYWNSLDLPEWRRSFYDLPNKTEVVKTLKLYTMHEVLEAISNYAKIKQDNENYHTDICFAHMGNFIQKGIEIFATSAKPFEKYAIQKEIDPIEALRRRREKENENN